jgi:hypothetical protein
MRRWPVSTSPSFEAPYRRCWDLSNVNVIQLERLSVYQRIHDLLCLAHRIPRPLLLPLYYGLAVPLADPAVPPSVEAEGLG